MGTQNVILQELGDGAERDVRRVQWRARVLDNCGVHCRLVRNGVRPLAELDTNVSTSDFELLGAVVQLARSLGCGVHITLDVGSERRTCILFYSGAEGRRRAIKAAHLLLRQPRSQRGEAARHRALGRLFSYDEAAIDRYLQDRA